MPRKKHFIGDTYHVTSLKMFPYKCIYLYFLFAFKKFCLISLCFLFWQHLSVPHITIYHCVVRFTLVNLNVAPYAKILAIWFVWTRHSMNTLRQHQNLWIKPGQNDQCFLLKCIFMLAFFSVASLSYAIFFLWTWFIRFYLRTYEQWDGKSNENQIFTLYYYTSCIISKGDITTMFYAYTNFRK